jgi:hypothetical protein
MYGLYLDDVRDQVRRLPTRYVSNTKKKFGRKKNLVKVNRKGERKFDQD